MSDIDSIIAAARKDARTVSSGMLRELCDEVERLRDQVARLDGLSEAQDATIVSAIAAIKRMRQLSEKS